MFQRVLRCENEKRIGEWVGLISNRHLLLLHGLEQSALDLGRRSVDLVRQYKVAENRPMLRAELAILRVEDHCADDVGRQHVWGELQALKVKSDGTGQCF